jgi:hypothetical protein
MTCTVTSVRAARAHRVEEMGHRARAAIEGQVRLGGGRVGVPAGDGDATSHELVDELEGAVQLGCERHLAHRAGVEQTTQQREVGCAAALGVVGTETLRRQERPLEVRADDARPAAAGRHGSERRSEIDLRRRDERRLERGDPAGQERLAGAPIAIAVGDLEVHAGEAVGLQIDEPRSGDQRPATATDPERGDHAILDLDVARQQAAVDERGSDAEPHGVPSPVGAAAPRTLPAASRRAWASLGSTPASSATRATSRSSSDAARAARAASSSQPAARQQMRTARSRSFAFATRIPLMRLPYVRPRLTISAVEKALSASFWAVPAFSRVEPAMTSGPTASTTA